MYYLFEIEYQNTNSKNSSCTKFQIQLAFFKNVKNKK